MLARFLLLSFCTLGPLLSGDTVSIASKSNPIDPSQDCEATGLMKTIRITNKHAVIALCTFNRNGKLLDATYFRDEGPYGRHWQKFRTIYNAKNQAIKTQMSGDEDPKHPSSEIHEYDRQGRLTRTSGFDSGGSLRDRTTYSFDDAGNIIKEVFSGADEKAEGLTRRHFDSAHRVLSEERRTGNEDLLSKSVYDYDTKGKLSRVLFHSDGITRTSVYRYSGDELLVTAEVTVSRPLPPELGNLFGFCGDCGAFPGKTISRYDANGFLLEEQMIQPSGLLARLTRNEYDGHRRQIKSWVYQPDSDPTHRTEPPLWTVEVDGQPRGFRWTNGLRSTTFTYDSHGNWIKAVVTRLTSNTHPNSPRQIENIFSRQIEYR